RDRPRTVRIGDSGRRTDGLVQRAQRDVGRIPAKFSEFAQSCACPEPPVKQGVDMAAPHGWHSFHAGQDQQHVPVDMVELRPQLSRQMAVPDRELFWVHTPISVQAPLDYLVCRDLVAEELYA